MPDFSISFSWATLARKYPLSGARSVPTMESATWCRTPALASAARRLRPEVWKNSSTALSSNEGELARSITAGVPAMASLRPWPVMVLTPVLGEAATTSWPPWRRMATVFEPIRPVPGMSVTRNVPSTEVCRPRTSPATFGSAPPSSRHTRYDARPRVKVTGVLSPERRPRDTKGARGGIPDEGGGIQRDTAGYRSFPQTYGIETVESVG